MIYFEPAYGSTPIEDVSDLIPTHINTRNELNEWETINILKATRKYLTKRKKTVIDINWIKQVHKDMFDETWKWAGKFRKKNYNIGIDWYKIPEELKLLVDDIKYLKEHNTEIGVFEQSIRIHHRLTKIHPFVNGNGRHARLVVDIFLFYYNYNLPMWPDEGIIEKTEIRKKYIEALRAADQGDYSLLKQFTEELIK